MPNTAMLGAYGDVDGLGLMFRNKLINGDMRIDQRNAGASQTFTAGAALAYSVDRWYGYCTGANVTGQRVAGSGSTQFRYQFTGAASVTAIGFGQRIEATNAYELAGNNATLSVDLSNSLLTTVTWTAYYANTADTFGTLASPTRTQIATGTFTVSSTLTRYSATMLVPTAATTGIEIVLTVGAQTSGTWVIGNVQLEGADQPTPFEKRTNASELALCQRYYEKSFNIDVVPANNLGDNRLGASVCYTAGAINSNRIFFKVTKRTTGSATLYNAITTTANTWSGFISGAFTTMGSVTPAFDQNGFVTDASLTGATVPSAYLISGHWVAACEL